MNFKELRKGLMVLANTLDTLPGSRHISLAKTAVQTAMMWTGTYMKFSQLGENPYAKNDGNRETVADILPMFDSTTNALDKEILEKGTIYTIDQIREYLDNQNKAITEWVVAGLDSELYVDNKLDPRDIMNASMCLFNINQHMTETRMWLGMELGSIRDQAKLNGETMQVVS